MVNSKLHTLNQDYETKRAICCFLICIQISNIPNASIQPMLLLLLFGKWLVSWVVFNWLRKLKTIWKFCRKYNQIPFIMGPVTNNIRCNLPNVYDICHHCSHKINDKLFIQIHSFRSFLLSVPCLYIILLLLIFSLFDLSFQNFDANFRNNSTLQTSAIIAVCSIFLLLVILFSSLFLWK